MPDTFSPSDASTSNTNSSIPASAPTAENDASDNGRLSDAELEALRSRDPQAVRRHVYGNRDFIESVLRRYTETEETAQDLLQETFFQALRSLPNFRGESKLSTWLYSIAKNVALARYRKDKRRSLLEEETLTRVAAHSTERPTDPSGEAPTWNPSEAAVRSEETALVQAALKKLSENYREVIELRDLKELSTEETAERMGLTRVNVRVRLHRARTKLKALLDERLDADYQVAG